MRVPKTELNQLLGAPGAAPFAAAHPDDSARVLAPVPPPAPMEPLRPATSPAAAETSVSLTASPPGPGAASRTAAPVNSDIRFELARALPALWAKAKRDFADGKAVREKDKLRDLLVWLLTKRNATVRQRQAQQFTHEGKTSSGRLDVVANLAQGGPPLAIEVDWAYARPSLEKLQAAHRAGMNVLWVCGAKLDRAAAKALRTRANTELGSTYSWLFMFHLEHGWL